MVKFGFFAAIAVFTTTTVATPVRRQEPNPKITITVQATTAAKALKQLGESAHVSLLTSPQTADEIITFKFTDVPLQEAMRRIATAMHAGWKQEKDAYRLTRNDKLASDEKNEELGHIADSLRKSIQEQQAAAKKLGDWDDEKVTKLATGIQTILKSFNPETSFPGLNSLAKQGPIQRALTRTISVLDPFELAGLPRQLKTVWSTNPTRMQRPMSPEMLAVMSDFVSEQSKWAAALDTYHLKQPSSGNRQFYVTNLGASYENPRGRVAKILLTSSPMVGSTLLRVGLAAFDETGKLIADTGTNISLAAELDSLIVDTPPNEPKVEFDEDAKALLEHAPGNPHLSNGLTREFVNKVTHPVQFDPLSFVTSNSLIQVATIKGVNLLAVLDDYLLYGNHRDISMPMTVADCLRKIGSTELMRLQDGWLTVVPPIQSETRDKIANRRELAVYLQRIATGRPFTLAEQAEFAAKLPEQDKNFMPGWLTLSIPSHSGSYNDQRMLRFYGMLSPDQRIELAGQGLKCSELNKAELDCLAPFVYGPTPGLRFQPSNGASDQEAIADNDRHLYGILREATESVPNGIGDQGVITMTSETSTYVVADLHRGSDLYPGNILDATRLARQKYRQSHLDQLSPEDAQMQYDLGNLQVGKRLMLTFRFQLTPTEYLIRTLEDRSVSDLQPANIDTLPDDFQKQVDAAYAAIVKAGGLNSRGGTRTPPPRW